MIRLSKSNFILLLLILFSLLTKSYRLTQSPPALFSDEVDAGYQAFVFNHCGSDYFGNKLPTLFHSFSDYRTPAYLYSIALVQRFTGPTENSVRIPSVIFSTLTLLAFYLYLKTKYNSRIGLIGAFLMALSPWAFHYGRTGFEVSGMLFFLILSLYFFEKFKHQPKPIFYSAFLTCLMITPYFYSTAKLFAPLILVFLSFTQLPQILKIIRHLLLFLILPIIITIPLVFSILAGKSNFRFSYISVFTDPTIPQQVDIQRRLISQTQNPGVIGTQPPLLARLLLNKQTLTAKAILNNYFSSFSTDFLFIHGDANARHSLPLNGLFYFFEIFLIFICFRFYSFKKIYDLLLFALLAPIPFALTRDSLTPHATRLIILLPFLISLSALGLNLLITRFSPVKYLFIPLYLLLFINFYYQYQYLYPQQAADSWHTGLKEGVVSALKNTTSGQLIYFSSLQEDFLPFFLFYSKYLPADCRPTNHLIHLDQVNFSGQAIDNKYFFGRIEWPHVAKNQPQISYVIPETEMNTVTTNRHQLEIVNKIAPPYQSAVKYYLFHLHD